MSTIINKRAFVDLKHESLATILKILDVAKQFMNDPTTIPNYQQQIIITHLFFESSTRTNYSFLVAAQKLGCQTINVNVTNLALKKGETQADTIKTFDNFPIDVLVVRSEINHFYQDLSLNKILINAGDGSGGHPTQCLLDLLTIMKNFPNRPWCDLTILFIGDIVHSRVAKSNIYIMEQLGMKVYVTCDKFFRSLATDHQYHFINTIDEMIDKVDIVYSLRYQAERYNFGLSSVMDFIIPYQLTLALVNQMKATSIVMHAAPFNRDIEIDSAVVECDRSRIYQGYNNGVWIRMALIHLLLDKQI